VMLLWLRPHEPASEAPVATGTESRPLF
jgi:hypothetical protein